MWDKVFISVLIGLAVALLIRHIYRMVKGKPGGGCSCGPMCPFDRDQESCPSQKPPDSASNEKT